jgi:hypothetical protein
MSAMTEYQDDRLKNKMDMRLMHSTSLKRLVVSQTRLIEARHFSGPEDERSMDIDQTDDACR